LHAKNVKVFMNYSAKKYALKQLKEVEEAAVTTKDYFQEQVCQLEKALHDTAENSLLLEQQVGALSFPQCLCGV
jgi:hypothetical protein